MSLELAIVTPYGEAWRGPVQSVVLPGSEGEFGVLEDHERFLSPLDVGRVEIRGPEGEVQAAIGSGFAEVNGKRVTLLVESCEVAADIDVARAEMARDRAREGLAGLGEDEEDARYAEYRAALERAENRLRVSRGGAEAPSVH